MQGDDRSLNDALRHAVYAYASRWLPFRGAFKSIHKVDEEKAQQMEIEVRDHFWRRARASIYAAMAQPSYRSILALFLFTFTEMPASAKDHGFGHLCSEVLYSHFNYMRLPIERRNAHTLSEYTTVLPPDEPVPTSADLKQAGDAGIAIDHLGTSMFWLGVICDSTRSLIQQRPSIVLPGRSGDGIVWGLIRQRNIIFDQSFRSLRDSSLPLGPDVTDIVLQHALACKTMYFGVLNQFCESATSMTDSMEDAAQRVLEERLRFHDTLGQLLSLCARDYSILKLRARLNYSMTRGSSFVRLS